MSMDWGIYCLLLVVFPFWLSVLFACLFHCSAACATTFSLIFAALLSVSYFITTPNTFFPPFYATNNTNYDSQWPLWDNWLRANKSAFTFLFKCTHKRYVYVYVTQFHLDVFRRLFLPHAYVITYQLSNYSPVKNCRQLDAKEILKARILDLLQKIIFEHFENMRMMRMLSKINSISFNIIWATI